MSYHADALKVFGSVAMKSATLNMSADEERMFWFMLGWEHAILQARSIQQDNIEEIITPEGIER